MKKPSWVSKESLWIPVSTEGLYPELPFKKGIFILSQTSKNEIGLLPLTDEFKFDFKVYGLETRFVNRVLQYYKEYASGNVGILLNGIQGTGKTITGKMIANALPNKVVIINEKIPGMNTFLSSLQEDLTIFIDEYEKIFDVRYNGDEDEGDATRDASLLPLMDGVLNTKYRRVFILTTNNRWVSEHMISRPGRIRYLKQFKDLEYDQIMEIINDCLEQKQFTEDIIRFMLPLEIVTVDIVKAIVKEVNMCKESPFTCCDILNLEFKEEEYELVNSDNPKEILRIEDTVNAKNMFENRFKNGGLIPSDHGEYAGTVFKPVEPGKFNPDGSIKVKCHSDTYPDKTLNVIYRKKEHCHNSFVKAAF